MTRSISSVLLEAANATWVPLSLDHAIDYGDSGSEAYWLAHMYRGNGSMYELTNEERSAFLYLCSLIAEDEE